MKDDIISRAAALDALDRLEYTPGEWVTNGLTMCKDAIKALPPASFENHDEIKSYSKDTISRQAAIETVRKAQSIGQAHRMLIQLPSAQPECEDDTKSHSEKDILNGCISLLEEMVCHFKDYMEWIGYEPNEEEKECGYFGMTYFHIVQHLFLWHTEHAGGTSTRKKCYELGIDEPSDGVRFPLWDDYDGEQDENN